METKDLERFLVKVANRSLSEDGCWLWLAGKSGDGYGAFWLSGRTLPAHVVSYQHFVGSIPDGLVLDHTCRNHACVNPAHLEPVTNAENIRRGVSFNGSKTHCPSGHEYGDDPIVKRDGRRVCRECNRVKSLQNYAKHRDKRMAYYKERYWKTKLSNLDSKPIQRKTKKTLDRLSQLNQGSGPSERILQQLKPEEPCNGQQEEVSAEAEADPEEGGGGGPVQAEAVVGSEDDGGESLTW